MATSNFQREGSSTANPQSTTALGPVCLVGAGGLIQFVNEAFTRKFGKRPADWAATPFNALIVPDDRALVRKGCKAGEHGSRPGGFEVRCITPQGLRWILWECEPAAGDDSSDVIIGQDVTRRHIAEEQSFILAQAVEQCPIGIAITEPEGGIRYLNARFASMTGKTLERLLEEESTPGTFDPLSGADKEAITGAVAEGRSWEGEVTSTDPTGAKRWESLRVTGIRNAHGATTHHLVLREDVTGRKVLEAQLLQSQKVESLGTLAGGIAHDFNNLLAIITGYAEMVVEGAGGDERMRRYAREIQKAGTRATGLVSQILTFSRKAEVVFVPLDLNELVQDIRGMVTETFPRTISFEFSFSRDGMHLMADRNQMQQVILNLCVNARDAMPDGGTLSVHTLGVDGRRIARLGADPLRHYACLRIADTGVGMPVEVTRRIFEPFFTTKDPGSGTGLGLAVVDGIVSRHEGFIEVESGVGAGSTFSVYLPGSRRSQIPATENVAVAQAPCGTGTILLADDEEALRNLIGESFLAHGYKVLTATNGHEAREMITERGSHIDAIVLDVNMPRLNGLAVMKHARLRFPGIRVLLMSGNFTDGARAELKGDGPDVFLAKPFRVEEIVSTLHRILNTRAGERVFA